MVSDWFFTSSKGLHQGDPLFSLLFNMVFEVLSKIIKKAKEDFISGFLVAVQGMGIVGYPIYNLRMKSKLVILDVFFVVLKRFRVLILIWVKVSFSKLRMC